MYSCIQEAKIRLDKLILLCIKRDREIILWLSVVMDMLSLKKNPNCLIGEDKHETIKLLNELIFYGYVIILALYRKQKDWKAEDNNCLVKH